jgi:hypothetical protein
VKRFIGAEKRSLQKKKCTYHCHCPVHMSTQRKMWLSKTTMTDTNDIQSHVVRILQQVLHSPRMQNHGKPPRKSNKLVHCGIFESNLITKDCEFEANIF